VTGKLDTSPPRGMRDLLPAEAELRDAAAATILDVYRRYGFRRVETPAVESIRLLARGEGGENEKLIFKILKRGERLEAARAASVDDLVDLGLRFDLTVPLARYYAHNHAQLPQPLKAVQIGPVWRAERPQKGRFRQFTQCDIDILGVSSEIAEIELILATLDALLALGLERPAVRINDRRVLGALARHCGFAAERHGDVLIVLDKLDKIGPAGVRAELAAAHAPAAADRLMSALDEFGREGAVLARVRERLGAQVEPGVLEALDRIIAAVAQEAGARYTIAFDPSLVRGMGYYTGPIFEVGYGAYGSSIAGGGRYDRMIGQLLGRDVPATGFSIGFERIVDILRERGGLARSGPERIAVLFDEEAAPGGVVALARHLREKGAIASLELRRRRLGRQLAELRQWGYSGYVLFEGDGRPAEVRPIEAVDPDGRPEAGARGGPR
jgi:histidyl-tRNA synthetase